MKQLFIVLAVLIVCSGIFFIVRKDRNHYTFAGKPVDKTAFTNKRDCIKTVYLGEIGVTEEGNNRGDRVEEYLASANTKPGNPWCGAFVTYVYKTCDPSFNLAGSSYSPAWFPANKTIYIRGKLDKQEPKSGDVIGIYFPEKGRIAHVGFWDSKSSNGEFTTTVEGNTSGDGSREGEGVNRMKRQSRTIYAISSWIQ